MVWGKNDITMIDIKSLPVGKTKTTAKDLKIWAGGKKPKKVKTKWLARSKSLHSSNFMAHHTDLERKYPNTNLMVRLPFVSLAM